MKILLITNYWYPYNNPGAFRWMGFGKYIDFDVLTSRIPSQGFKDLTMEDPGKMVFRFGIKLPSVMWGFIAPFVALFFRYDLYIITSPPESFLFGAYILQSFGKNVLVDMRDPIYRPEQGLKFMVPFYRFFYKKLEHIMVSWQFIDPTKPCVYHGYDEIEINENALKEPIFYTGKVTRESYLRLLSYGVIQDYSKRPVPCVPSSYHTIKKLGYHINRRMNHELYTLTPVTNKESADKILRIISNIFNLNNKNHADTH